MTSQSHEPTSSELAECLAALLAKGDHAAIHDLFAQSQSQLEQVQVKAVAEIEQAREQIVQAQAEALQVRLQNSQLQMQTSNLQAQSSSLQVQARKLAQENNDLRDKTQRLETRVKHLTRILYGRKSEKLTKEELGQLILAFGGDDTNLLATIPLPLPLEARTDEAPEGDQTLRAQKSAVPTIRVALHFPRTWSASCTR